MNNLKLDWVLHHTIFAGVAAMQLWYHRSCLPFTWLIVGEASTVILNMRIILLAAGKTEWIPWINILFVKNTHKQNHDTKTHTQKTPSTPFHEYNKRSINVL